MNKPYFKRAISGQKPSASEHNKLRDVVAGVAGSSSPHAYFDSTGLHTRRMPVSQYAGTTIFVVYSTSTGDGVYVCYMQTLLDAEWDGTGGNAKFDDLDAVEVEVLNLSEAYPEGSYFAALSAGDLLAAWQIRDDGGTYRWVGIPFIMRPVNETFNVPRSAKLTAVGTITLSAKLLDSAGAVVGDAVTVYPREHLGTNLLNADVWPDLFVNDYIVMIKERDNTWYFIGVFDDSTVC